METIHDDRFMVFLRHDLSHAGRPDYAERPVVTCSTYEEACQIRRRLLERKRDCIIRFVGPAGGGD
jgi:hypothetical protein